MPAIIPAVVGGGIGFATAGTIGTAGVTLFSVGLRTVTFAFIAHNLANPKRISAPNFSQEMRDRKISNRGTISARQIIYGEVRTGGVLYPIASTGTNNKYHHVITLLSDSEVESLGDVYFDENISTFYDQFSEFQTWQLYYSTIASNTTSINATVNGNFYTTSDNNVSTLAGLINAGETDLTASVIPTNNIRLTATVVSDFTASGKVQFGSNFRVANIDKIIPETILPYRISKHLGADDQLADTDLVSEVTEWTNTDRLQGIAYIYVRFQWSSRAWINGVPNVSAIVQGKKVFDPRTGLTAYSNNAVLCQRDYLTASNGFAVTTAEVDDTLIIAGANICDEDVLLDVEGNTQKRYVCNGVVVLSQSPRANLEAMLSASAGNAVYTQGVFKVYPGAYTIPVGDTLTADMLRGDITVRAKTSKKEIYNAVKGTFIDKEQQWEAIDFPPVTNSFYATQDGEQIFLDVEFPFTTNSTMAQRLAKIMLERSRQGIAVNFPANMVPFEVAVNDNKRVDIDQLGWGSVDDSHILDENGIDSILNEGGGFLLSELAGGKQFKVTEWTLNSGGGIDLTLIEEASEIYDWNLGNETVIDIAPNSTLASAFDVASPSSISIESGDDQLLKATDGTIISRMLISWTPSVDTFVNSYDVAWKKSDDAQWTNVKTVQTEIYATGVEDLQLYDIKVRGVNTVGSFSTYTETTHTVIGKSEAPPDVDIFLVRAQADGTREFTFSLNAEPLDHSGFKIKYIAGSGGVWANMSEIHSGRLIASPFESNQLAAGSYTFGVKAVDTTGNESANAKIIEFTLPDPRITGSIGFFDFRALGWLGTLTNAWISEDADLHATDQGDWTTLPATWSAWTTWANNPYTSISDEHPPIDVGVITTFIPLVTVTTQAATILIEEAHSDDGIGYTNFATVTGSEIVTRFIKLKVTITDVINNPATIENITVILSAKPVEEITQDLDTSTLTGANRIAVGHIKVPIQQNYVIVKKVDVTLQNVGPGWDWELISKTDLTNGPEIKIYNGSGALADATIDITVKGIL